MGLHLRRSFSVIGRRARITATRRFQALRAVLLERRALPPPRRDRPDTQYRILFVCRGNICRSPIAQGILRQRLADAGLFGHVAVESAGTSDANSGKRPDPRARVVMLSHGLSIQDVRARQFRTGDFDDFDLILVMDDTIRADVLRLARNEADRRRVRLLAEDGGCGQIGDPVMGTLRDFARAYEVIEQSCEAVIARLVLDLGQGPSSEA